MNRTLDYAFGKTSFRLTQFGGTLGILWRNNSVWNWSNWERGPLCVDLTVIWDIVTTSTSYAVTASGILLWVFVSKQDRIPRTGRTVAMVLVRTLPLFLGFLWICRGLNVSVLVAMLFLALFIMCLFLFVPALGPGLGILGILYVLKQWILGWPDKQDMVLEPPSVETQSNELLSRLVDQIGMTASALRPCGHVVVVGREYPARSDQGYIEPGVRVRVVDAKDSQLTVRPLEQ